MPSSGFQLEKYAKESLLTPSPGPSLVPSPGPSLLPPPGSQLDKYAKEICVAKLPKSVLVEKNEESEGMRRRVATPGSLHLHPNLTGRYANSENGG